MSKKYERMRRERRARNWMLLRYAMPMITVALTLIFMAIPSLQYTNNQSGTDDPISAFTLMGNSWEQVRTYLFGTAEQTNGNIIFSRTVLILLIVFWLLFALSVAAAVWALRAGFRYTEEESEEESGRLWFITLIPNRIALTIYGALLLPLAAFPRILILLYRNLYVSVSLTIHGIEPLAVALFLTLATAILSVVSARDEKKWSMNPFRKPRSREEAEEREEPLCEIPYEREERSEESRREYREQVDRVAALFLKDNSRNDEEEK